MANKKKIQTKPGLSISKEVARKVRRNPQFPSQSLSEITWTRVVKGKFPERRTAVCCSQPVRSGEIVVTFPCFSAGSLVGTVVVHVDHLKQYLADVPSSAEDVQLHFDAIRERFVS